MNKLLSLTIGGEKITAPGGVPTGGIEKGETILQNSIQLILVVAVLISLFVIIWGGITWSTSGGDKAQIEAARKRIIYALLGLVLAFLAFFIVSAIGVFFRVPLI